jgi:CRP-like cAMP-binding protein
MSAELLKTSPLFRDFTPVGLGILSRITRPRVLLAGNLLFAEGAPSEALYLVFEGRLQLSMKGADGREVPLGSLGAGEHLGQVALISEGAPTAHLCTATADLDTKILEIPAADFRALMREKPQACMKLMLAVAQDFGRRVSSSGDVLKHVLARAAFR